VARKDLSRTVIEGGRYYSNCYFRRASHGDHRARTRDWLDRVADDVDIADEVPPPRRERVGRRFHDKLGPAHRWLVAQCGRPWDKVYADLCARFDTRTIAGRHVVHDHMLAWVRHEHEPTRHHSHYGLVIDAHGILRTSWWFGRSWKKERAKLDAWAQDRVASKTYRGWYWFARIRDGMGKVLRFEPRVPLTKGDLRRLDRIPVDLRSRYIADLSR
jgi:hypothetical protein